LLSRAGLLLLFCVVLFACVRCKRVGGQGGEPPAPLPPTPPIRPRARAMRGKFRTPQPKGFVGVLGPGVGVCGAVCGLLWKEIFYGGKLGRFIHNILCCRAL